MKFLHKQIIVVIFIFSLILLNILEKIRIIQPEDKG